MFYNSIKSIERSSVDTQFATSVLGYGKILDNPSSITEATYDLVLELANKSLDDDKKGKKAEFIEWVNSTKAIIEKREELGRSISLTSFAGKIDSVEDKYLLYPNPLKSIH